MLNDFGSLGRAFVVPEDIASEVLERAFGADDNLGEDTKRFIDRQIAPGEKAAGLRRRCAATPGPTRLDRKTSA